MELLVPAGALGAHSREVSGMDLWAATLLVGLVAAGVWDIRTRRIPNLLVGAILALDLLHIAAQGVATLGAALGGAALGLLVAGVPLFVGYLFGGIGAGDVKLAAAVGAFFGWPAGLAVICYTALLGGLLSLAWLAWQRGLLGLVFAPRYVQEVASAGEGTGIKVPYALAVLGGAVATVWVGVVW